MHTTGNTTNTVLPYWNEIKNWSREERSNLAELINQQSPKLMKGLAEYAVKEHRAGRCLTQEQVEKSVMEAMGWN